MKCKYCGSKFIPGVFNLFNKSYCSFSCRNKSRINTKNKSEFSCKWCGEKFTAWTYRNPKFCSRQCMSEYGSRQPRPKSRKDVYIELPCAQCGKLHKFNKHQIRLRGGKYCSKKCKYDAMSISKRGLGNINYKGGKSSYRGPNWGRQSRATRKRDKYTCQICGSPYSKFGIKIDVHHIKPYRIFNGDFEKANDLSNLIVLCKSCHAKVECGKSKCPHPKK